MRRAIGVTTGTALIAGLSVIAVAPGAVASDLDEDAAAASTVSESVTPEVVESTDVADETAGEAEVDATETSAPEQAEDVASDEAPVVEESDPSDEVVEPESSADATDPATDEADLGDAVEDEELEQVEEDLVSCPGIDDGVDYRTLFDYEYFASDGQGGFVSLGSTTAWGGSVSVDWVKRPRNIDISSMMVRAVVTLKSDVDISEGDCSYDFSLASYEAQGSTWVTSGQQVFIDHDFGTITEDVTSITLDVAPGECFTQSDLYRTSKVYRDEMAPRGPFFAPITGDGNMIANWMGGTGCETEPTPTPTPIPTDLASPEPSPEPSVTDTPTEPASPEPSDTETEPADPELVVAAALAACDDESLLVGLGLVNDSDAEVTFDVVVDGVAETVVLDAGSEAVRDYETSLDAVMTVLVEVDDTVLLDEAFSDSDCEDVVPGEPIDTATTPAAVGPTTPATQPRVLARTGAETWTVALVAALLLAAGGALVALGGSTPRGRRQA